jgi:uncharacterized membrane protein
MDKPPKAEPRSAAFRFRRYFATGLLVLAPLWLTIYVVMLVVRLFGSFLSPYFRMIAHMLVGSGKWIKVLSMLSDFTAFVVTVILITLIGMAVRRVIGQRILKTLDRIMSRIPVVREIYDSIRKFIEIFFGDKTNFQRVVAVQFPTKDTWAIGFVTGENGLQILPDKSAKTLSVFVATSPNPTSGFTVFCAETDVIPLDLSVDEAMKLIVSGGTLVPYRHLVRHS